MTYSSSCSTCRRRRVKCDGGQPACQRCIKAGRDCPGPTHRSSIMHSENAYASGQQRRPRGPRSNVEEELKTVSLELTRQPSPCDLKTQAVTYYVHCHLKSSASVPSFLRGIPSDFVTFFERHMAHVPMIDLAVSSMALATFSQTQKHLPAATEGSATYGHLLTLMRTTLLDVSSINIDVCLFIIFFMSRYEDVVHGCSSHKVLTKKTPRSFSHHDGALALLKEWKLNLHEQNAPTDIIKYTRRGLIRSAILRSLAVPVWMQDGSSFGEQGLDLMYDACAVRTANVRHEVSTIHPLTSGDQRGKLEELQQEAGQVYVALGEWASGFPKKWCCELAFPGPCLRHETRLPDVSSCIEPAYDETWCLYFALRMFVNGIRLKIDDLQPQDDDGSFREKLVVTTRSMATALSTTLPTLPTNPRIAGLSVWPLCLVAHVEHIEPAQKSRFKMELIHVGQVLGSGVLQSTSGSPLVRL